MKKERINGNPGITLIALIITIIILLILAGVTISLILGDNGLFKTAKDAVTKYDEKQAREKLEGVLLDLQADKIVNKDYNEKEYINKKIQDNKMTVNGDIVTVDGWQFMIDRSVPKIIDYDKDKTEEESLNLKFAEYKDDIKIINYVSNYNYPTLEVDKAFNGNITDRWNSGAITNGEWPYIGCAFSCKVYLNKISLYNYAEDATAIKEFKVQYSNNNIDWNDLPDIYNAQQINTVQTYEVNFDIKAKYWRIQMISNYGYANNNCSVKELGLEVSTDDEEQKYIIVPNMASNTENTEADAIYSKGVAISNYVSMDLEAYLAFDNVVLGNPSQWYRWNSGPIEEGDIPYVGYIFPTKVNVKKIKLNNFAYDTTAIKTFKIQYSIDDGNTWNDASDILYAELLWGDQIYDVNVNAKTKYWRIQTLSNYGYEKGNCSVAELQFYAQN